ncbi:tRNA pseudouridine(38-40) synthase TruA [Thiovibrio sp. JS02]
MGLEKKRFKLVLEFDGGRYSGWQKQEDARSVQGSILQAAAEIFAGEIDVQGNGRTDAGVHGLRFVAHLEAATGLAPVEIGRRLNEILPHDINLLECKQAGPRFHARHNCIGRSYLYQIARRKTAFCKPYVWWIKEPLDLAAMREAAGLLEGMHDFSSFTDRQVLKKKSPLVLVNRVMVAETADLVLIRVVGSHFLWKMVRRIVGVLCEVGKGSLPVAAVGHFLAEPANLGAFTAPAQGLFFERAFYDQDALDSFLAGEVITANFF